MKRAFPYLKTFFKRADMLLFSLALVAALLGIVMIYSATRSLNSNADVITQAFSLLIGIGLFVLFTIIDIDIITDHWLPVLIFSVVVILALIPFGSVVNGSKAWIHFLGVSIQPTEIVKVTFIVLLAKQISYRKEYGNLNAPLSMLQILAHFLLFFGLVVVVAGDLGSALVFFFIFLVMLFVAGIKLYWFAAGIGLLAAATPLIWSNVLRQDQKDRILAPYVPGIDRNGDGVLWQQNHSKLALASGQFTGTGLLKGPQTQSVSALPEKQTDFIFGAIGEELGMIGCILVIALLVALMVRCVYVGVKSKNTLNMLVCFGVAAMLFFQTFENIGMCLGIAPVIGITLPLFSYGGSSLFCTFAALGIVSGIRYRPKPERFRSYG